MLDDGHGRPMLGFNSYSKNQKENSSFYSRHSLLVRIASISGFNLKIIIWMFYIICSLKTGRRQHWESNLKEKWTVVVLNADMYRLNRRYMWARLWGAQENTYQQEESHTHNSSLWEDSHTIFSIYFYTFPRGLQIHLLPRVMLLGAYGEV